jgi:hypothetical protein
MDDSSTAPGETEDAFEPVRQLRDLQAEAKRFPPSSGPGLVQVDQITILPDLFQPRSMNEKHIEDLARIIKTTGKMDPVTVLKLGNKIVLVDGHHRLEAYRKADVHDVAVTYFEGTPEEAVLEAGRSNSKAKLPMSNQERQNYGWRLVLLNRHSKAQITAAAGISHGQVATMRKVRKVLGHDAINFTSWFRARGHAQGTPDDMDEADREQWKVDVASRWSDLMAKHFSTSMANRPEVAAMALATYFGRRLPEVVGELQAFVPEDDGTDEF